MRLALPCSERLQDRNSGVDVHQLLVAGYEMEIPMFLSMRRIEQESATAILMCTIVLLPHAPYPKMI